MKQSSLSLVSSHLLQKDRDISRKLFWHSVFLVAKREWHRIISEPSRLLGMFLQPLLFFLVFGLGFHDSFRVPGSDTNYITFLFPGILALVVLFSSIYATLTLVDDKKCGFFRLVLSGPGGIFGAILGKIIGTTSLGFVQGIIFLSLGFLLSLDIGSLGIVSLLIFLLLGSLCCALIGIIFAWISETSSAFHALMSVILIPMWLLSGSMFPLSGFFYWLSLVNPLAYMVKGLRLAFTPSPFMMLEPLMILLAIIALSSLLLWRVVYQRSLE